MSNSSREIWSDDELKAALDAYLYMLQMQLAGIPFSANQISDMLLSGPLSRKNSASIRYRMRNISAVVVSKNLPPLSMFSPAEQVGRNVWAKLEAFLTSRKDTLKSVSDLQSGAQKTTTSREVSRSLDELKRRLSELEALRPIGIGHNNPPGEFEFSSEEVRVVIQAIDGVANETDLNDARDDRVKHLSEVLISFGLKAAVWTGQRITDFAKASAIAAGSGFGLHLSGLGKQILSTLDILFKFF